MKIAFLGSRGIPACYSGFETFYEQLATRLVARGHAVTVYNRRYFMPDARREYRGVRIVALPSIPTKHLDTISHTALSTLHALFQGYDIVYYCIVGNSPLVWLPRLVGAKILLNVDGADWAREKWSGFARWYQRWCERLATRTAQCIVADSRVIRQRYRDLYGSAAVYVPYGANVAADAGTAALEQRGLRPRGYVLYVGRFVPENAIDVLIRAFRHVRTGMQLVLIGDAPHSADYKRRLAELAAGDPRIIFTGYVFGQAYAQLSSHACLAVQPSAIEGTRPALLDQMGFGNAVIVRNSSANLEVVGDCGACFDGARAVASLTETMQELIDSPERAKALGAKARQRIENYYNWEWIADFHAELFERLARGQAPQDYDGFLAAKGIGSG